jgi:hypothetical protein
MAMPLIRKHATVAIDETGEDICSRAAPHRRSMIRV